jgi:putative membrane protein insertion efficiency factor
MINRLLQIPIRLWQACAAPILPPCCRFHPSCSHYALEALERHSWPWAMALIAWRLMRCQPWHPGGYDPVPSRERPRRLPTPITGGDKA